MLCQRCNENKIECKFFDLCWSCFDWCEINISKQEMFQYVNLAALPQNLGGLILSNVKTVIVKKLSIKNKEKHNGN